LYAVLLAAYFFLTVVPLLIESSYVYSDPSALARRIERRLGLERSTSKLFDTVTVGASGHKLAAALPAAVNLFFFGLGIGRVLQLVHARSWGDRSAQEGCRRLGPVPRGAGRHLRADAALVLQTKPMRGDPSWIGWVLDIGWRNADASPSNHLAIRQPLAHREYSR
jgi:hypothetical protein